MDVSALISAIGSAMGITKTLMDVKAIADSAEAKMAIAELASQMAEVKVSAAELRVQMLEKDDRIRELETALKARKEMIRHNELYYLAREDDEPTGDPYCPLCFEADSTLIHLVHQNEYYVRCPKCENKFPRDPNRQIEYQSAAISDDDWRA